MAALRTQDQLKKGLARRFTLVGGCNADPELMAEFAAYLCVQVTGYVEQTIRLAATEYASKRSDDRTTRYVASTLTGFQNANFERILQLVARFDKRWRSELEQRCNDEMRNSLGSVLAIRNQVAHGASVDITYQRSVEYFRNIEKLVDMVVGLFAAG